MERTLILVKPDAMQRGLAAEVLGRLERRGLRIVGLKLLQVDRALAERHYGEHAGKPFYEGLVSYITACPIVAAVFEGTDAVQITVTVRVSRVGQVQQVPDARGAVELSEVLVEDVHPGVDEGHEGPGSGEHAGRRER